MHRTFVYQRLITACLFALVTLTISTFGQDNTHAFTKLGDFKLNGNAVKRDSILGTWDFSISVDSKPAA